jgi:hypothetical protein
MTLPTATKGRPAQANFLALGDFENHAGSTLDQLIALIDPYTHVDPILPQYTVGPLVPDLDLLGADINHHWQLQGSQRFFQDEIEPTWTVFYLAAYIDLKRALQP